MMTGALPYRWEQPDTSETHLLLVRNADDRIMGEVWRNGNVVEAICDRVPLTDPPTRWYSTEAAQRWVEGLCA